MPEFLGKGMEGVVHRHGNQVIKIFWPDAMSDSDITNMRGILPMLRQGFPSGIELNLSSSGWQVTYPWFDSDEVRALGYYETVQFLIRCLDCGVAPDNFKLANLRRTSSGLVYIDIGKQIRHMTQPVFRDTCAKAYVLMTQLMDETTLIRDFATFRSTGGIDRMVGFNSFYLEIIRGYFETLVGSQSLGQTSTLPCAYDTTLLIKCCAMDSDYVERQVCHIVAQLSTPRRFLEVVVLLDTRVNSFLRQHSTGNIHAARSALQRLLEVGVITRILEPPEDHGAISDLHIRWFAQPCSNSHTLRGIPVFSQLWSFEQVRTRYVIQCDCDVIIGRQNRYHDYLSEMHAAHEPSDVMGVGFNIPQEDAMSFKRYDAPLGEFKPEVRLGLFDLCRLAKSTPWTNPMDADHLTLGWYQSLHLLLKAQGLRCVRGGDPRTFYLHPLNETKRQHGLLDAVRSFVESGCVPNTQQGKWDIVADPSLWRPVRRYEDVVFLLMGRNTPEWKLARCFASLRCQEDQSFGIIVVDDASIPQLATAIVSHSFGFEGRITIVHNHERLGRVPNKWNSLNELVVSDATMVAVLDLDDALMSRDIAGILRSEKSKGTQLVVGGMFRPDKPLKLYPVDFSQALAHRGAGNVWNHLRAFTKSAYSTLKKEDLQIDGKWHDRVSDYLTMVPMAARTQSHKVLDGFLYWHERTTPSTLENRLADDQLIDWVLDRNKSD